MKQTSFRIKEFILWFGLAAITLLLILFSFKSDLFFFIPASEQSALNSLEEITPIRFKLNEEGHVVEIFATDSKMNDEAAAYLRELPELQRLHLERSGISDASLKHIASLNNLKAIFLDETAVTDSGMVHLKNNDRLQEVSLTQCNIGDETMSAINQLAELKMLNLSKTNVTDAGMQNLEPLEKVETLYLSDTKLTGMGIQALGEMPSLTHLDLSGAEVDVDFIEAVRQFPNLELLYLGNSTIDDKLIPQLMSVLTETTPKLRGLSLKETALSDSAIPSLKLMSELKNLAIVQLQNTRITKPAFKQLASVVKDVNFSVDYSEKNN